MINEQASITDIEDQAPYILYFNFVFMRLFMQGEYALDLIANKDMINHETLLAIYLNFMTLVLR
ncbi:MAG: hypothetical protein HUJ51_03140 [Eggerthellaceae bacterium]|nr:hypothetical protein [Eggerthellaceae bacterium]